MHRIPVTVLVEHSSSARERESRSFVAEERRMQALHRDLEEAVDSVVAEARSIVAEEAEADSTVAAAGTGVDRNRRGPARAAGCCLSSAVAEAVHSME